MFKVFGFLTKREGIEMRALIDYYENKLGPLICDRTAFLGWMAQLSGPGKWPNLSPVRQGEDLPCQMTWSGNGPHSHPTSVSKLTSVAYSSRARARKNVSWAFLRLQHIGDSAGVDSVLLRVCISPTTRLPMIHYSEFVRAR
jgi:hypothetical protein